MYPLLIILCILNVTLFAMNVVIPAATPRYIPPLTEPGIPALELMENVMPVVYSSSAGITNSSCYTIGPYLNGRSAQLVMARIRNYGLAVQMRSLETIETLNYQVYIPAQNSLSETQAVLADLEKHDVKQYRVLDTGTYKNAIALGVFEDMNKAMRHVEYIRYLGYDARYAAQQEAREVFWLDYDEPFGSNTPVPAWSKAVDSDSAAQLIPRACRS